MIDRLASLLRSVITKTIADYHSQQFGVDPGHRCKPNGRSRTTEHGETPCYGVDDDRLAIDGVVNEALCIHRESSRHDDSITHSHWQSIHVC